MNLEIEYGDLDKDQIYKFCNWLIEKIQQYLIANINVDILARFDSYINENDLIIWVGNPRIARTYDIIVGALYNLEIKDYNDYYDITINPNINIPNSYAKFIDIVGLIDKGNLMLSPYPIITQTMEYFADNLKDYYEIYLEEIDGN